MNDNVIPIQQAAPAQRKMTDAQISLIRRTVAADCDQNEFDLFMEIARQHGLDPFRKQIFAVIYNADKPEKRQMVTMVSIDGMRSIAMRNGDYRPASTKPEIEIDEAAIDPKTNPKGIVEATVYIYKQANNGEWFPVVGTARWDEFAPIVEQWAYNKDEGRRQPTGEMELKDGFWVKMPTLMLAKCAEAQALRKGWPEVGMLYTDDELEKSRTIDATASEVAEQFAEDHRQALIGHKGSIPFSMTYNGPIEWIPLGQLADRIVAMVEVTDAQTLDWWRNHNEESLKQFWARAKADALACKELIERKIKAATEQQASSD